MIFIFYLKSAIFKFYPRQRDRETKRQRETDRQTDRKERQMKKEKECVRKGDTEKV